MKLILHIGTPKTASTFLQNSFRQNPEWLAKNGVIYPEMLTEFSNHITLMYISAKYVSSFAKEYGLKNLEDVDTLRGNLDAHLKQIIVDAPADIHTMVLSSENLTANLKIEGIAALHTFLKPHFEEIKIVCYLRRQDDSLLSMYSELMRVGTTAMTFPEFIDTALNNDPNPPYLHYKRLILNWHSVFGRKSVAMRLFSKDKMINGDVLNDFCSIVFNKSIPDMSEFTRAENVNESLSINSLEFLRRFQVHCPYLLTDGSPNPERGIMRGKINQLPSLPKPQMSLAQSTRIMAHFADQNEWLGEKVFKKEKSPLFPARTDLPEKSNMGLLSREEYQVMERVLMKGLPQFKFYTQLLRIIDGIKAPFA